MTFIAAEPEGDFISTYSPWVFENFGSWVLENYPEDAAIMFDFEVDMDQAILDLYEVNLVRLAESLRG